MKTENILIIAAGLAAGYYVGKKKEEDAAVGAPGVNNKYIYPYILDAIDCDGYDGVVCETDKEKMKFLWETFISEHG